jgi:hypothetical protein
MNRLALRSNSIHLPMPEGTDMTLHQTDAGPPMTEDQSIKLRQGIITGHMRYVLGISLTLSILALVVVYLVVRH